MRRILFVSLFALVSALGTNSAYAGRYCCMGNNGATLVTATSLLTTSAWRPLRVQIPTAALIHATRTNIADRAANTIGTLRRPGSLI